MLKDEFYNEYNIPKVPIPIKSEELGNSMGSGGLSFPVIVDNMIGFLEEEPSELENYRVPLATLSYYAGMGESSRKNIENAYNYLKISRKYGHVKNISIIQNLALTCLQLGKIKEAIEHFEFAYVTTKNTEFLDQIWAMLAICYFMDGQEEKSFKIIKEFFNAVQIWGPSFHNRMYQSLHGMASVFCKDEKILREIEKYA